MNYDVVPLNGGDQFDLNGVRFDGKSFIFWKKKGSQPITKIVTVFDKKYENIPVSDGVAILSLKGLINYNDIKKAVLIFQQIIQNKQVQFHFIVGNENERQIVEALGNELGLSFVVQNLNQNVQQSMEQKVNAMEEDIKREDIFAGSSQVIEKYDNGKLQQISVDSNRGVAYENVGMLSNEEEKVSLLREWMQDPVRAQELSRMSVEARNELLTQAVMSNRREYRLESASEVVANDIVGEVAKEKASQEDGLGNTELGIVQNKPSSANEYYAVERNGDNARLVAPNVVSSNLSSSGVNSSGAASDNVSGYNDYNVDVQNEEVQEQQRSVEQVFYIDDDYNVLNENDEVIGKVGPGGEYMPNYEDNTILKSVGGEMQVVGYIGDSHDKQRGNSNSYSKPKVYTKKKPDSEKSAAFVSLPVIIFILSAILLIVSAFLLFIVD